MLSRPAACLWHRDGLLPAASAGLRPVNSALCPDSWLKRPTLPSQTTCAGARATAWAPAYTTGSGLTTVGLLAGRPVLTALAVMLAILFRRVDPARRC